MATPMKERIATAFLELAQTKPIDRITVKELTDYCDITRQTFYYHFKGTWEVIEWCMKQSFTPLLNRMLEAKDTEDAIAIYITFIKENASLLKKILISQRREYIQDLIIRSSKGFLSEVINRKGFLADVSHADLEVFIDFCAYGISGTVFEALMQFGEIDEQKLSEQIANILHGTYVNH